MLYFVRYVGIVGETFLFVRPHTRGMTSSIRAFIAVDIPFLEGMEKVVEEIKATQNRIRFVSPEQCHVTLKFIGNIGVEHIDGIKAIIDSAVDGIGPMNVVLIGMGTFPNAMRPRVIWIGLEGGEGLIHITKELDSRLEGLGVPKEKRPFRPHLTIGRVKYASDPGAIERILSNYANFRFGTATIDRIILKKSVLTPNGPIYSDIYTAPLNGRS